jgi:hypothetical protein
MVVAMTSDSSSGDGFLSRWSHRKQALRKGEVLPEPEIAKKEVILEQKRPIAGIESAQNAPDLVVTEEEKKELPPAPTMQDVQQLTPESDFKPFMRSDVSPEVKNAAMKQLFKDPHFNTMDMMDVYVDDYSKPDPLPPEMLRKMAVTQFLGFWKEEEEEEAKKRAREDATTTGAKNVAQSEAENNFTSQPETTPIAAPVASSAEHDHPDLQLQPDDAAGREASVQRSG